MNGRLGIKTRVRIAKYTKLNEAIPSFIYAGWYQVRTAYRNQPIAKREGTTQKTAQPEKFAEYVANQATQRAAAHRDAVITAMSRVMKQQLVTSMSRTTRAC